MRIYINGVLTKVSNLNLGEDGDFGKNLSSILPIVLNSNPTPEGTVNESGYGECQIKAFRLYKTGLTSS
jgi:hypothetical protein